MNIHGIRQKKGQSDQFKLSPYQNDLFKECDQRIPCIDSDEGSFDECVEVAEELLAGLKDKEFFKPKKE